MPKTVLVNPTVQKNNNIFLKWPSDENKYIIWKVTVCYKHLSYMFPSPERNAGTLTNQPTSSVAMVLTKLPRIKWKLLKSVQWTIGLLWFNIHQFEYPLVRKFPVISTKILDNSILCSHYQDRFLHSTTGHVFLAMPQLGIHYIRSFSLQYTVLYSSYCVY